MTQKYFFLLAFLFSLNASTIAQRFSLGVKTGISSAYIDGNSEQLESSSFSSLYFGVLVNKAINDFISFQAELNYSSQGGNVNGLQPLPPKIYPGVTFSDATKFYVNYKSKTLLNYIEVPLLSQVSIHIGRQFYYHMNFGPYVAFCIKAQNKGSGTGFIYSDQNGKFPVMTDNGKIHPPVSFEYKKNIKDEIKTVNAGAISGLGLSYVCGKNKIFLDGRFKLDFTNIQTNIDDGKKYTGILIASVGYLYKL